MANVTHWSYQAFVDSTAPGEGFLAVISVGWQAVELFGQLALGLG